MRLAVILMLLSISGCAYISKTDVSIQADKAQYPLMVIPIKLDKGTITIHRETNLHFLKGEK